MKLTRRHCAGMYSMLAAMPPFDRFDLPTDARIEFRVNRAGMHKGMYEPDPHTISISKETHDTYHDVLQTMAHEMAHLALERQGRPNHSNHCSEFNALAAQICNIWGWNFKEF